MDWHEISGVKGRMAEGHQAGIIVAHAFDSAGAHTPHQPDKPVFPPDLRRPAVQVAAEGHPGSGGQ